MTQVWRQAGIALLSLALFGGAGTVLAQSGVGQLEVSSTTTDKEKLEYSDDTLTDINRLINSLQKSVEDSTRNNKQMEADCLESYLSNLESMKKTLENSISAMNSAIESGDEAGADHQFRKITIMRSSIQDIYEEAKIKCLGEDPSQMNVTDTGIGEVTDIERVNDGTLDIDIGNSAVGVSPFE